MQFCCGAGNKLFDKVHRELALLVCAKLWGRLDCHDETFVRYRHLTIGLPIALVMCCSIPSTIYCCFRLPLEGRPSMIGHMQLELPALIVRQSEYSSHHRTNGHRCYLTLPRRQVPISVAAWPEHNTQGGTVDEEP
jgi:hypothetical protein